jgi:hypothetical protein
MLKILICKVVLPASSSLLHVDYWSCTFEW